MELTFYRHRQFPGLFSFLKSVYPFFYKRKKTIVLTFSFNDSCLLESPNFGRLYGLQFKKDLFQICFHVLPKKHETYEPIELFFSIKDQFNAFSNECIDLVKTKGSYQLTMDLDYLRNTVRISLRSLNFHYHKENSFSFEFPTTFSKVLPPRLFYKPSYDLSFFLDIK